MAFMAGSVFADLVLDTSKWTEGIQKAQGDLARIGEKAAKLGGDMSRVGKSMSIAGASIVGAFGAMLKSAANAGDQVAKLSQKVGVSVKDLSSYRLATQLAGTSLDSLGVGMRILSTRMKDARDGSAEAAGNFKELGVEVTRADGTLRDTNDVLLDVADKFAAMEDGALKTALAQRTLGRSGAELIPLLNLGRKGLEENRKEAERLGLVFTDNTAKASENFNDSITRLKGAALGLSRAIVTDLMPHVTKLIDGFKDTVANVSAWIREHPRLVAWITKTAVSIGALLAVLGPVVFAIGKMTSAIGGAITGVARLLPLIIKMAPALGQLAAVGAAAFVGWKIGRAIGELTGLDRVIESAADKTFRFLGIIKETNIELAEGHARTAEIQRAAIERAVELTGRAVNSFIEAKRILQREFADVGTTGDAVLDAWIHGLPPVKEKTKDVAAATIDWGKAITDVTAHGDRLNAFIAEYNQRLQDNLDMLTAERLDIVEVPIELDLDGLEEQTDVVSSILAGLVDTARNKGAEVTKHINDTLASLRGPTIADIREKITLIKMTLEQFGDSMPVPQVRKLKEEINSLKRELGDVTPWEKFLSGAVEAFQQIEGMIMPIIQKFQHNKEIAVENEYKKRLNYINKSIVDEEARQKAVMALEAEYEIKKTEARRAAAKTEKAVALMGAIVNTAEAVTKALAQGGFLLGVPWAAIVGAMGAAQVAAIAAQPIPLAEGATFEKPTLLQNVLVGEKRPEYLLDKPKLTDIVRDALMMPRLAPVPAFAGGTAAGTGTASVSVSLNGPLIQTTGLSRQDLWAAGEELREVVEYQLSRVGRR